MSALPRPPRPSRSRFKRLMQPVVSPAVFDFWASRFNRTWSWERPLARVVAREQASRDAVTLFDSVGFATEDFSALRYVRGKLEGGDFHEDLDLLADPDEPRDLLGMLHRAAAKATAAA